MKVYELIVLLSRYLFVIYMLFFIFFGAVHILSERKVLALDGESALSKQRMIILLMHITAFLVISFEPGSNRYNLQSLYIGGAGLVFFLTAYLAIFVFYKESCHLLWNSVIFLLDLSIIMLTRLDFELAAKQIIWIFLGFSSVIIIPLVFKFIPNLFHIKASKKHNDHLYKFVKLEYLYLITGLLLLSLPFILGEERNGSINWINILGFSFQPSEIVKFLFIFYIASCFQATASIKRIVFVTAMSSAFVLILVLQRDLGGALIFFMTYMIIMYISTGRALLFFTGMLSACGAAVAAYYLFSHVRVRVSAWLDPWQDISTGGYQIIQSLFAIGTWGTWGSGLTLGFPKNVPVYESDFIFAAICEEFGSIFAIGLICVFILIIYRGVHISLRCKRKYYSLLAAGFTAILAFQTFLILGGNIKLIPLTGVTLPFVSYGGSSIFVSILSIGILEWIYISSHSKPHMSS